MIKKSCTFCEKMRALWNTHKGNGCTSAPDFHDDYTECCNRHDSDYATHADQNGLPISRERADRRLYACMKQHSKTFAGKWIVAPFYFAAVRVFGASYWKQKYEKIDPDETIPPTS